MAMPNKPLRGENVSVAGHSLREDQDGSHVQYHIEVEWGAGAPWIVFKRYSEFEALHKSLVKFYGNKQVPGFTKKKRLPVGGTSHGFVEKRMLKLEQYLRDVVEQWSMWFQMGEEPLRGPGTMLGVNEFIFMFLEFPLNAIIGTPATASHEGEGFFVPVGTSNTAQSRTFLPLLTGLELASLLAEVKAIDIADDDSKVDCVLEYLTALKEEGKNHRMNIIQLKALLGEVFFQNVRVALIEKLFPLVQDQEHYPKLLCMLDFDDDIKTISRLCQEALRRRDGITSSHDRNRGVSNASQPESMRR